MEELVAEWLEYQGFFVKRNERVGPRAAGGHEGELDVVGYNPKTNKLVHCETSTDTDSWANREKRFAKKFACGTKYIRSLFVGMNLPDDIEKRAVFAIASDKNHKTVGGGKVVLVEDLIIEILHDLKQTSFWVRSVPEKFPILRVLQIVASHRDKLLRELSEPAPAKARQAAAGS